MRLARILAFIVACVLLAPLVMVLTSLFEPIDHISFKILTGVMPGYLMNTIMLLLGAVIGTLFVGAGCAYIITFYDLPYKRLLHILLLLPLAIAPYMVASVYAWQFEFNPYIAIRSVGGAVFVFTFTLYPYVYLLCWRFLSSKHNLVNISLSLGKTHLEIIKALLPVVRPALVAGGGLVAMEVIADFGVLNLLAVDGFTTGIYRMWFEFDQRLIAMKLAATLFIIVAVIFIIEQLYRNKTEQSIQALSSFDAVIYVHKLYRWILVVCCVLPVIIGFAIPLVQMIIWAAKAYSLPTLQDVLLAMWHTIMLSVITAILAVAIAWLYSWVCRYQPMRILMLSSLGYAVPGVVVAVGILYVQEYSQTVILSGSLGGLILAYLIRFMIFAKSATDGGLSLIPISADYAAATLGSTSLRTALKIHIPQLLPWFMVGAMFVAIEVIKELPVTYIIRPFNTETLATYSFMLASDERIYDAAIPMLIMIAMAACLIMISQQKLKQLTS